MGPEERKLYSRGYNAGRKFTEKDLDRWDKIHDNINAKDKEIRRQYFCAALTGLLQGDNGWKLGDEKVNNSKLYCRLAWIIAEEAIKKDL